MENACLIKLIAQPIKPFSYFTYLGFIWVLLEAKGIKKLIECFNRSPALPTSGAQY